MPKIKFKKSSICLRFKNNFVKTPYLFLQKFSLIPMYPQTSRRSTVMSQSFDPLTKQNRRAITKNLKE